MLTLLLAIVSSLLAAIFLYSTVVRFISSRQSEMRLRRRILELVRGPDEWYIGTSLGVKDLLRIPATSERCAKALLDVVEYGVKAALLVNGRSGSERCLFRR